MARYRSMIYLARCLRMSNLIGSDVAVLLIVVAAASAFVFWNFFGRA